MHGWVHENNSLLDAATERELMLRAHDVLTPLIGSPPVGFRSANWDLSPNTIAIVAEMGLLYDSSLMADEVPYELLLDGRATVYLFADQWANRDNLADGSSSPDAHSWSSPPTWYIRLE